TVAVTDVKVYRNDTLLVDVTNPDSLYDYVHYVPVFHVGDSVKVVAAVTNTTGGAYFPPTFVYLHVRHVDPTALVWRRIRMQDNGDGTYTRTGSRTRPAGTASRWTRWTRRRSSWEARTTTGRTWWGFHSGSSSKSRLVNGGWERRGREL